MGDTLSRLNLVITNDSGPPNDTDSVAVSAILLTPSCGVAAPTCPPASIDLNVFSISPTATGALLSACQGITFNVAVFNAVTGELSFTPANNTTLTAAIGAGDATILIASPTGFGNSSVISYLIRIDTELLLVTSGQGTTTWGVSRGVNGTTAAAHASGATVNNIVRWRAPTRRVARRNARSISRGRC